MASLSTWPKPGRSSRTGGLLSLDRDRFLIGELEADSGESPRPPLPSFSGDKNWHFSLAGSRFEWLIAFETRTGEDEDDAGFSRQDLEPEKKFQHYQR